MAPHSLTLFFWTPPCPPAPTIYSQAGPNLSLGAQQSPLRELLTILTAPLSPSGPNSSYACAYLSDTQSL